MYTYKKNSKKIMYNDKEEKNYNNMYKQASSVNSESGYRSKSVKENPYPVEMTLIVITWLRRGHLNLYG